MKIFCSWEALKQIKIDNNLEMYYYDTIDKYEIILLNGDTVWFTILWKILDNIKGINISQNNIDKIDFETNYKISIQKL